MLLAAYLGMFHGSILLNCKLRGCNLKLIEENQVGIFTLQLRPFENQRYGHKQILGKLPYQERRHLHSKLIKIDDEWDGLRVMAEFEIQNVLLFIS